MEEGYGEDGGRVGRSSIYTGIGNATPFSSQNNPTHNTAGRMTNQVTVYSFGG